MNTSSSAEEGVDGEGSMPAATRPRSPRERPHARPRRNGGVVLDRDRCDSRLSREPRNPCRGAKRERVRPDAISQQILNRARRQRAPMNDRDAIARLLDLGQKMTETNTAGRAVRQVG